MEEEFRVIPGYDKYGVDSVGIVISFERNIILSSYFLNNYFVVDTFRDSLTETLPIHRAVALAWVNNPNPNEFNVVNHIDGNTFNNHFSNLEWTNYSGNNYHAIASGLRRDNLPCKIRNFQTKEIFYFDSIAQCCEFIGLSKDTHIDTLQPKMFGKLVCEKYEFKFQTDDTPWFYENRNELVKPSRFMVEVTHEDGKKEEVYSNRDFLKRFQLYGAESKAIPALAEFGAVVHPEKTFVVRDSFSEEKLRETRKTNESLRIGLIAKRDTEEITFESLTKAARFFNVDRSSIISRLNNGRDLDGWVFSKA